METEKKKATPKKRYAKDYKIMVDANVADLFEKYCKSIGKTKNAVLVDYIIEILGKQ